MKTEAQRKVDLHTKIENRDDAVAVAGYCSKMLFVAAFFQLRSSPVLAAATAVCALLILTLSSRLAAALALVLALVWFRLEGKHANGMPFFLGLVAFRALGATWKIHGRFSEVIQSGSRREALHVALWAGGGACLGLVLFRIVFGASPGPPSILEWSSEEWGTLCLSLLFCS